MLIVSPCDASVEQAVLWLKTHKVPEVYLQCPKLFKQEFGKFGLNWLWALCQSCLETGFFTFKGDVKPHQWNLAGIGAIGGGVPGDSFISLEVGVRAQSLDLALRAGLPLAKSVMIAPHDIKNYDQISSYKHTKWEQLTNTYAADGSYFTKIQKLVAEFEAFSPSIPEAPTNPLVECISTNGATLANTLIKLYPEDFKLFHPETPTTPANPKTRFKVLLNPGHYEKAQGASGKNKTIHEWDLNVFQANFLQKELIALGIETDIVNQTNSDLYAIGQKADGYNIFWSLHLNASDGQEHYGCTMVHNTKGSVLSKKFGSLIALAMTGAIGSKCFQGTTTYKGVMEAGLSVLSGAEDTSCEICILSELEFIDDEIETTGLKHRIEVGLKAAALATSSFLRSL
jgi:N-acetylmuramoyl-L-alanine amidase